MLLHHNDSGAPQGRRIRMIAYFNSAFPPIERCDLESQPDESRSARAMPVDLAPRQTANLRPTFMWPARYLLLTVLHAIDTYHRHFYLNTRYIYQLITNLKKARLKHAITKQQSSSYWRLV